MKCEYCGKEHPKDQIANPHYCIARLTEVIDLYEGERELDKQEIFTLKEVIKELRAEQSNYRKQIAALKAENQGLHDVCLAEMKSVAEG